MAGIVPTTEFGTNQHHPARIAATVALPPYSSGAESQYNLFWLSAIWRGVRSSGISMKKFVFAASLLAISSVSAFAADMAVKAPPPAPAAVWSWTGFYIGGDLGWYDAKQTGTTTAFPSPGFGAPAGIIGAGVPGFGNLPTVHGLDGNGAIAGLYAGYNWQVGSNWLLGVEGDWSYLNRSSSNNQTVLETFSATPAPAFSMVMTANTHWLASARARAGWTSNRLLLYVTGGVAFSDTSYSATDTGLVAGQVFLPGVGSTVALNQTKTGWVAGGGAEWMLTQNWLLRAEYLHYEFDGSSTTLPLVFANGSGACPAGACNWNAQWSALKIDTVRAGLSYKFGGPVARY
jgi:outer membrane immunogenic protein